MGIEGMIGMGPMNHANGHGSSLDTIRQEEDVKPIVGDRAQNGDVNHDGCLRGDMDVEIDFLGHGHVNGNGHGLDHSHYHGLTNGFSLGLTNGLTTAHRKFGDVKCENSPPDSSVHAHAHRVRDGSRDVEDVLDVDAEEDGEGQTPEGSGSASVSAEDHDERDRGVDEEELEQRGRRGRDGRPGVMRLSSAGKRDLFGSTGASGRVLRNLKEETEEEERMQE